MVPVALGTQTAGSVIRPAAYCGVYGYKPARGWISTKGVWLLDRALRHDRAVLAVGRRSRPALRRPAHRCPARIPVLVAAPARVRAPGALPCCPARNGRRPTKTCAMRSLTSLGRLSDKGWEVSEMAMPATWRRLPEYHDTIMAVEVAKNLRAALGPRVEQISDAALGIVERGDRCPAQAYLGALEATEAARAVLAPLSATFDLLLTPSALGVAPVGHDFTGDPVMCRAWTLLCLPASNVPAYRRADGLPVGVQAVAPRADDARFLDDLVSLEADLTMKE